MQAVSVRRVQIVLTRSATNTEFARVANAYVALKEKPDQHVVFVRVPIDLAPNVFTLHGIVSAPSISFLPSNEVLGKKVLPDLPSLMA